MKRIAIFAALAIVLALAAQPAQAHGYGRSAGLYASYGFNVTPFVPTVQFAIPAPAYNYYAPYDPCQPVQQLNFAPAQQVYQAAPRLQAADPQPANVPNDPVPVAPAQPQPVYYQRVYTTGSYQSAGVVNYSARFADPVRVQRNFAVYHYRPARFVDPSLNQRVFASAGINQSGQAFARTGGVAPGAPVAIAKAGPRRQATAIAGPGGIAIAKSGPRRSATAIAGPNSIAIAKAGPRRILPRRR
jgi:hypothetical protein